MIKERNLSRFRIGGIALLVVAVSSIAVLWATQHASLNHETHRLMSEQDAGPRVRVARVDSGKDGRTLNLQGEAMPFVSTTLFAKVSGFLREVRVDKGSVVRQGQILAVIESVEVDRDAQALKADAENKHRYAERVQHLNAQGIISARDLEDANAAAQIAKEKLASQAAVQGYRNVVAPYSGVITQRFADPGALIQNASSSTASQPLLSVAQVDHLRVSFYLDQELAPRVKVGQELEVRPMDRPDQVRTVKIARLAGALDPKTRTLLAEADLDNRDNAFLAGGAVQVTLKLPAAPGRMEIPSEAVLLKGDRPFAAVVGSDGKLNLRPLLLGEDNGTRVQVLQGLQPGDRVVLSPAITAKDGDRVQAVDAKS